MSIWSAINKRYGGIDFATSRRRLKSRGQGKGERWTGREDILMRKWYLKKPTKWLANKLRRSAPAVTHRAKILGLQGVKKRWTPADDAFLRKWYAEKPIDWLAEQLGRKISAVRARATVLGVHKHVLGRTHRILAVERLNRKETTFKLR